MLLPTDRKELAELYDIRSDRHRTHGGNYEGDLHGQLARLRETGPVHEGSVAQLVGAPYKDYMAGEATVHYSAFDWETCSRAFRDGETFSSAIHRSRPVIGGETNSIIGMDGTEHRRYRSLVQPMFVRRQTQWWSERFIMPTLNDLISGIEADGSADLGLQLFAGLPLFVTTRSIGIPDEEAFEYSHLTNLMFESTSYEASQELHERLLPLIEERRRNPSQDLLSVLAQAELTDEDGRHKLSDDEITAFARLLLVGGIGTTWRQLGILLLTLLVDRSLLTAVDADRSLLAGTVLESLRWEPNIPLMRRLVTREVTLGGVALPQGSIVELSISAASRDPDRWHAPDEFDIHREPQPIMGYGGGAHVCLGMHVANAEMEKALGAILDRLPNLRLDPDAEVPAIVGFEHRAVTALPVVFG